MKLCGGEIWITKLDQEVCDPVDIGTEFIFTMSLDGFLKKKNKNSQVNNNLLLLDPQQNIENRLSNEIQADELVEETFFSEIR